MRFVPISHLAEPRWCSNISGVEIICVSEQNYIVWRNLGQKLMKLNKGLSHSIAGYSKEFNTRLLPCLLQQKGKRLLVIDAKSINETIPKNIYVSAVGWFAVAGPARSIVFNSYVYWKTFPF